MNRDVAVCTVTFNAARDVVEGLESVARLERPPAEVVVVDCASTDDSVALARSSGERLFGDRFRLLDLRENRGFAGGMNAAIAASAAGWILSLNADARPDPTFVERLLEVAESDPAIGAVTGRLLRPPPQSGVLDACGMRLTLDWRHLDRGSGEIDRGLFDRRVQVFGATGAASLFRRQALEDVSFDGEVFDPDFHSFREDAELCFRLQERSWKVLYEPRAMAVHRRSVLPERRRDLPPEVNYHSLKNRYLLRAYHQTWSNLFLTLVPTLWRDLLILPYVLLFERSSLAAYGFLWRHRRRILQRRRWIQQRRQAPARQIDRWFLHQEIEP